MRTRKFNFVGKCSFKFFFIYLFICCLLFLVYFRQSQQEHPITLQLWLFWFCLSLFCIFVFCLLFAVIRFTFYILYIMPIFHFSFFNACCSSHVQWVSWSRRNRDAQSKSSESNMKEDLCFSLLFPPINTYCAHISFFFSFFVHLRLTLRWCLKILFLFDHFLLLFRLRCSENVKEIKSKRWRRSPNNKLTNIYHTYKCAFMEKKKSTQEKKKSQTANRNTKETIPK